MVNKISKLIESLKAQNKPFWVVALLKMDDLVDRWSLVLAAPWIKESTRDAAFHEILDLLKANLERDELISLGQMVIGNRDEHLFRELLKRRAGTSIEKEKINGNLIHEGTIIESNPDLKWQDSDLFSSKNVSSK